MTGVDIARRELKKMRDDVVGDRTLFKGPSNNNGGGGNGNNGGNNGNPNGDKGNSDKEKYPYIYGLKGKEDENK